MRDRSPTSSRRFETPGRDWPGLTVPHHGLRQGQCLSANQERVDSSAIHYVASLAASNQRSLITEANAHLKPIKLSEQESVQAYRTRRKIWAR